MKLVICFSVKAGEMPSRGKENTSEINPVDRALKVNFLQEQPAEQSRSCKLVD
jgi:hypothetical protein